MTLRFASQCPRRCATTFPCCFLQVELKGVSIPGVETEDLAQEEHPDCFSVRQLSPIEARPTAEVLLRVGMRGIKEIPVMPPSLG